MTLLYKLLHIGKLLDKGNSIILLEGTVKNVKLDSDKTDYLQIGQDERNQW